MPRAMPGPWSRSSGACRRRRRPRRALRAQTIAAEVARRGRQSTAPGDFSSKWSGTASAETMLVRALLVVTSYDSVAPFRYTSTTVYGSTLPSFRRRHLSPTVLSPDLCRLQPGADGAGRPDARRPHSGAKKLSCLELKGKKPLARLSCVLSFSSAAPPPDGRGRHPGAQGTLAGPTRTGRLYEQQLHYVLRTSETEQN